jgi:hypothetical protein
MPIEPTEIPIPVEIRATVETTAFFDALRRGDYAGAARAQERLRALGWDVARYPAPQPRRSRPRTTAPRLAEATT